MENGPFLFAAYGVAWAVIFGFIFVLLNRQKNLRREIDSLKQALQEKQKSE